MSVRRADGLHSSTHTCLDITHPAFTGPDPSSHLESQLSTYLSAHTTQRPRQIRSAAESEIYKHSTSFPRSARPPARPAAAAAGLGRPQREIARARPFARRPRILPGADSRCSLLRGGCSA